MKLILYLVLAAAALYGLHRLALWMEDRGWIYWTKKRASSTSVGTAFLEIQKLLEPSKQHLVDVKNETREEDDDSGEPPSSRT